MQRKQLIKHGRPWMKNCFFILSEKAYLTKLGVGRICTSEMLKGGQNIWILSLWI